ncbi:beta-lactamase superfamily domain-containing protein [Ditylenchus destructor]|uniref:Beta-lactamase superfamily domain-containing protein n=1 Tax=Ditylenchus destructor TaxID=166010 RepID=A0AAD4NJ56_9BILA|nr:beta-lactamase superfamily domain-containing protein [Ditylenchus destructor]
MADFAKPIFNGRTYDNPSSFTNWSGLPNLMDILRWKFREPDYSKLPSAEELDTTLPVQTAKFNLESQLSATWLGHATVFVHLDGVNFITDPVWASRASPFRLFGPRRYRPPPCQINDLPQLNFAVISHNHYDHFDSMAVRLISKQFTDMEWFVPMGMKQWFDKYLDTTNPVTEMTWGDKVIREYNGQTFEIWCVPAQHWSQRLAFDRNKALWCGFAIIGPNHRFYYTG